MSIFNIFRSTQSPQPSTEQFYTETEIVLPQNFAQSVMQLEMHLEFADTYNLEVVQQLNEFYKTGIEYYMGIQPKKANHFKSKLTSLLTNPNTLDVIQSKPQKVKQNHTQIGIYNRNLRHQLGKFNSQSEVMIKSMLQGSQKKLEKHNKLIGDNIENQQQKLKRRIQERSRSKSRN